MTNPFALLLGTNSRLLLVIAIVCGALVAAAVYFQKTMGLDPCPMCIVQRIAFIVLGLLALIGSLWRSIIWQKIFVFLSFVVGIFGAFVAARQTYLQWYPPEFASCSRDFYGIIESSLPWRSRLPLLFQGTGDCAMVDWSFLGLSMANWSFIFFAAMIALLAYAFFRGRQKS